jgi:cytochrome b subunit of formate dehydrogenase
LLAAKLYTHRPRATAALGFLAALTWAFSALAQPRIPHGIAGREECLTCHSSGPVAMPADHAGRGNDTCAMCHQPRAAAPAADAAGGTAAADAGSSRAEAATVRAPRPPAVPHTLEGRAQCGGCHSSNWPADHAGRGDATCTGCHRARAAAPARDAGTTAAVDAGAAAPSSGPPAVPHTLEGRAQCSGCHSSGPLAMPADHAGRGDATCTGCHRAPAAAPARDAGTTAAVDAGAAAPSSGPAAVPHTLEGRAQCSGCHSSGPLAIPADHAGRGDATCTGCHRGPAAATAAVDAGAAAPPSGAPALPHTVEGREACGACHGATGLRPMPTDHAGRGDDSCLMCHAVPPPLASDAGTAAEAGVPGGPPAIPHTLEGRAECGSCHGPGGLKPMPADHEGRGDDTCAGCHAAGGPAAGGAPAVPHTLEGRSQCGMCHGAGGVEPPPADHDGRTDDTCLGCHAGDGAAGPSAMPAAGGPPAVPHPLEGREQCGGCHGPGGVRPMPADHGGRSVESCTACHAGGSSTGVGGSTEIGDADCLGCHASRGLSFKLPSGEEMSLFLDTETYRSSIHGRAGVHCTACHAGYGAGPHGQNASVDRREYTIQHYTRCRSCHVTQYTNMQDSMHAQVLADGNRSAPVCTDCHTAHAVMDPANPRPRISQTCARCHSTIVAQYRESVHGAALYEESNADVPTCSDCHGVHSIADPRTTEFRLRSPQVCARCHADPVLMGKYKITADVFDTYVADFHGTTVELFQRQSPDAPSNKAVCYDCHGVHDIKKVTDPDSHVIKQNLIRTCQRCHPGADPSFIGAWAGHYRPSPDRNPITYYVKLFYVLAIPGILGFMILIVLLDAQKRIRARLKAGGKRRDAVRQTVREYFRFTGVDRVEHWIMVVAFTMLAVTGLPQMFSGTRVAEWIIAFFGGIEMVRTLHHLFAIVLILSSVFHLTMVAYKVVVRRSRLHMMPGLKDGKDFLQWFRYVLGLTKDHPKFGRYSFEQKIEYLALVWGTAVMIVTGFILLTPIKATSFLPGEIVPAAKTAHGYEAILAVLAVIIWHFYGVHVRQWNRAMLTGTLDEHQMKEEHALELERLEAEGEPRPEELPSFKLRKRIFVPTAIFFFLLCVVGIKLLLTEDTSIQTIPTMEIAPYSPAATPPGADAGDGTAAAAPAEPVKCELTAPPAIPHPVEGRSPCSACHAPGSMKPMPGDHAGRAEVTCTMCHAVGWRSGAADAGAAVDAGAADAASAAPGAARAVPHTLEGRSSCSMCHGSTGIKPVPGDHAGRTDDTCTMCHAAAAAPAAAVAPPAPPAPPAPASGPPAVPHTLDGRADCGMCHGAGGSIPMPADHAGRGNDTCTGCHRQGDGGR